MTDEEGFDLFRQYILENKEGGPEIISKDFYDWLFPKFKATFLNNQNKNIISKMQNVGYLDGKYSKDVLDRSRQARRQYVYDSIRAGMQLPLE